MREQEKRVVQRQTGLTAQRFFTQQMCVCVQVCTCACMRVYVMVCMHAYESACVITFACMSVTRLRRDKLIEKHEHPKCIPIILKSAVILLK